MIIGSIVDICVLETELVGLTGRGWISLVSGLNKPLNYSWEKGSKNWETGKKMVHSGSTKDA